MPRPLQVITKIRLAPERPALIRRVFLCLLITGIMLAEAGGFSFAQEVNLAIIAKIESSNNPLAYNPASHARGMYQITPICLKDYNIQNRANLSVDALFNPSTCYTVAKWYIATRIPQLLKNRGIVVTTDTILIAYNAGISWVGKKNLPKETVYYLKKYARLSKER